MNLREFFKILQTQWITVLLTLLVAVGGVVAYSLATTPVYEASTRLFVSANGGDSLAESYQGSRYSQERVISYTQLLMGETLAQRTIDKLGLSTTAGNLKERVTASARVNTVLIDVRVEDESPVRARDIANALSDEFVTMVRELEMPTNGSEPDSRVIVEQRASIPGSPIVPKTERNIAIGLAMGALLGIGFAILRDQLDNTFKDTRALESVSGVASVGNVPLDRERRKSTAIKFDADNSAIAEAFRKIRTNLQFLAVDNPPRVIVVTSSLPGEGKSTTSLNLALALAEAEHNVLIVDGDMRRPTLHKNLDLIQPVGFSTVLSGAATIEDALQKTPFPGLTALTSGAIPPNPSELLGSLSAKKLLSELRLEYDYVIVDSTPLLAVTDAAILAAAADGVLLIARHGQTKREQLAHAVSSLQSVGATILGTVFTMVPIRGSESYAYTYYGATAPTSASSRLFSRKRRA